MRPVLFLLALAFPALAGCADEGRSAPSLAEALGTETRSWEVEAFINPNGCAPAPVATCFGGSDVLDREFFVERNERIVAFDLTMEALEEPPTDTDRPVNLKVLCPEAVEPCLTNATFEARSPLPVHLTAAGMEWPFGASFIVQWGRDPDIVAFWQDFAQTIDVRIRVDFTLVRDPALPAATYETKETPFRYETTTGVCAFMVEPGCTSGPWRTLDELGFPGEPLRIVANATWTAASPASQELRFRLRCIHELALCPGYEQLVFQGPSPLAIDTGDLQALGVPRRGAALSFSVAEASIEPVPEFTTLTRQPFVFEGVVISLVEILQEP
jgi:hypothetical protein